MPRLKLTDAVARKRAAPAKGQLDLWDTLLPGFGLRISYGGKRTFQMIARVDGKQRRMTVGPAGDMTLAEARAKARQMAEDAANGIGPARRAEMDAAAAQEAEKARPGSIEAAVKLYLSERVDRRQLRTAAQIRRLFETEVIPPWEGRRLVEITRSDVRDLVRAKAEAAPARANELLSWVRAFLNFCVDEELIEANPAARLAAPAPKVERDRVLSDGEVRAILSAFDAIGWPFGPLFKLLLLTAQRREEVAGMRWGEVDLEAAVWTIPSARAKSGAGHLVPLAPSVIALLRSLPRFAGGNLIFPAMRDGPGAERSVSGFSKAKCRVDDLSGVSGWRLHDLRRTAATRMRELGADRLTVSKCLNHAEQGVTARYDRYMADKEKRAALDAWAAHVVSLT